MRDQKIPSATSPEPESDTRKLKNTLCQHLTLYVSQQGLIILYHTTFSGGMQLKILCTFLKNMQLVSAFKLTLT